MKEAYKEIPPESLRAIEGNAWSVENMEAHGASERSLEYIGSRTTNGIIYDYYEDNMGEFWYDNWAMLPTGEIVSMERRIFGREIKRFGNYRSRKTK